MFPKEYLLKKFSYSLHNTTNKTNKQAKLKKTGPRVGKHGTFFCPITHTVCWFVRLKRRSRLSLVGIGHHRICAKLLAKVYRKHFPIEATADGACLFGLTACRLSAMQIVVCHERKSTPFLPTHWEKTFLESFWWNLTPNHHEIHIFFNYLFARLNN